MNAQDIKTVTVVGAGLMGAGIAQEFALAGYEVRLNDVTSEKLDQAIAGIRANLQRLVGIGLVSPKQAEPALDRVRASTVLTDAVRETDLVIEAVFENLALKQEVFGALDKLCPERSILASNTSSLLPSRLASATRRPDKVLVTHYYNPPYLVPLVEVVSSEATSDETVTTVYDLLVRLGKRPALVRKEVSGFIGNRLQAALLREALSIVELGIASPQDVDIVFKSGLGRRWAAAGPFEIFEVAGWDTVLSIWPYLVPFIESSPEAPALLKERVDRGELGVKTGKGFYEWTPESAEALMRRIAEALVNIAKW